MNSTLDRVRWPAAMWLGAILACCGEPWDAAIDEPLQVIGGTFKPGSLKAPPAAAPDQGVLVTAVELATGIIGPGERRVLAGRASEAGHALALQMAGLGTGYWLLGLDGLDPQFPGERSWNAQMALGHAVAPGLHSLRLAAVDGAGMPGPSRDVQLCVPPPWPDNLNACDPMLEPPEAVLELTFDQPADVDLEVRRPDGSWVGGKGKGSLGETASPPGSSANAAVYHDRDAGAGCQFDARLREHIVWTAPMVPGTWGLHVRLHNACGQAAVGWRLRLLRKEPGPKPKTWQVVEAAAWQGQLVAVQADAGHGAALLVGELQVGP